MKVINTLMKYTISQPLSFIELGTRDNQEDAMFPSLGDATTDSRTFVVCDGMGGHDKGEVASNLVCNTFAEHADNLLEFSPQKLTDALIAAYDALDASDDNKASKKMGTTLAFLQLHSNGATIAHIGDSRVYYISPSKKEFFVTTDHSLVQSFFEAGLITKEQMKHHPQRNTITRVMMPHQENRNEATIDNISDLRPGDYFLLCSDGVLENLDDDQINSLFCNNKLSDAQKYEKLRELSKHNSDNHTAQIIKIESVENDEATEEIDWSSCNLPLLEINNSIATQPISSTPTHKKSIVNSTIILMAVLFALAAIICWFLF